MSDGGAAGGETGRTALVRTTAGLVLAGLDPTERRRLDDDEVLAVGSSTLALLERDEEQRIGVAVHSAPQGAGTVLEVTADDRPFMFSTVLAAVERAGLTITRSLHPILEVARHEGEVVGVEAADGRGREESFVRVEVAETLGPEDHRALGADVVDALADLESAAGAADGLADLLNRTAAHLEDGAPPEGDRVEAARFARWLRRQHFLATGAALPDGSTLGVGADADPVVPPPDGRSVVVRRSTRTCRIHRAERAAVVTFADPDGGPPTAVVGITTLRGRAERPSGVPWVRSKLTVALDRLGVLPRSHSETTVRALFDDLPWDVLLVADAEFLADLLGALLQAVESGTTWATVLAEPGAGAVTAVAAVPVDDYRPTLDDTLAAVLRDRLGAVAVETSTELGERGLVTTSATGLLGPGRQVSDDELAGLADELRGAARSWPERVRAALDTAEDGSGLWDRWAGRLPATYREATSPEVAAEDLRALDTASRTSTTQARLVGIGEEVELRIVAAGPPPSLSELVPAVESHGLVATEETTFRLTEAHGDGGPPGGTVLGLVVRTSDGAPVGPDDGRLTESLRAVWSGLADVDALNRLVVLPGLRQDEVAVLRAYVRYLAQLDPTSTVAATAGALAANPMVGAGLWAHFAARFEPGSEDDTTAADPDPEGRTRVLEACDAVARLDHDRLLRHLLTLVDATVRTNRWARRRGEALALQLDGGLLRGLGDRPAWREVWVSSGEVEGVHLRAGPIARGGLRWSDRADDVRTEVRQLMEAQRLKNALIVPTGAKGGFVVRRRPSDPAELRSAVEQAYRTFVTALLDVTDNLVDGAAVRPAGVRAAAGDDPYLVVAADRGTATFSDVANSLAAARGFWLGDAFASGGSAGYDHKALGVTARGAWQSVTEHFARRLVDVAHDPVRVVGIGDMSGDVFGNGLLRSRAVRLVAAFDHRHVFLDPDPDPDRSFDERRRLFDLAGSSWDDVDRSTLSPGALVHPRTVKQVELTPECRTLLGTDATTLSTPELVRAVLAMPTDLLYLGGIGTFVRGDTEPDHEVGDPANREVRVTATGVGAAVVVEGANLGITPRGRVGLADRGVAINADAVDNSAGVDTSDHEVNLKILLGLAESAGRIDRARRDALLSAAADEVVAAVLGHVAEQNRALTRAEQASADDLDAHVTVMTALVQAGRLDPDDHALPDAATLAARRGAGRGLLRPELAAVMAAEKVRLTEVALEGSLVDRPQLQVVAEEYVPAALRTETEALMASHPLRREIVAARLVNEVVDRMGITWVASAARTSGRNESEVLGAYWMARCTVDLAAWWDAVDEVPVADREVLWGPAADLVGTVAEDFLRRGVAATWDWSEVDLGAPAARVLAHWRPGDGLGGPDAARPGDDPAARADDLRRMALAAGLAEVAAQTHREPEDAVDAFLGAGDRFGIDDLTLAVLACELPGDEWAMRLRMHLLTDLDRLRRACARMLLGGTDQAAVRAELDVALPHVARAVADAAPGGTPGSPLVPLAAVVAEMWLVVERLGGPVPLV